MRFLVLRARIGVAFRFGRGRFDVRLGLRVDRFGLEPAAGAFTRRPQRLLRFLLDLSDFSLEVAVAFTLVITIAITLAVAATGLRTHRLHSGNILHIDIAIGLAFARAAGGALAVTLAAASLGGLLNR